MLNLKRVLPTLVMLVAVALLSTGNADAFCGFISGVAASAFAAPGAAGGTGYFILSSPFAPFFTVAVGYVPLASGVVGPPSGEFGEAAWSALVAGITAVPPNFAFAVSPAPNPAACLGCGFGGPFVFCGAAPATFVEVFP